MAKPRKNTKLDYDEVLEIRDIYPDLSMRKLAKMYDVSKTLIYKIIHEMIYKPETYEGVDDEYSE